MSGILVIVVVFIALSLFFGRRTTARRRRSIGEVSQQIARSIETAGSQGAGSDIGRGIADAVQQALAERGLPTGKVTVTTRTSTASGGSLPLADVDPANLGIGDVTSTSSAGAGRVATVELDAIGEPKRRVTIDLPDAEVARGDRIYVRLDPGRPDAATFLPGMKPPATRNRLDPLVLQPMLLARGEAGKAVVRSAETAGVDTPLPAGASAWRLELEVSPRNGFPYRAEVLTTVSTPEKAARLCHPGAEVAVRYDPDDPKTVMIDAAAMGLASPSATTSLDIPGFDRMGTIERIKAVRERSGLDLKGAKDLVESLGANPSGLAAALGGLGAQASATSMTMDWNSLAGMSEINKIAAVRKQTGLGLRDAKDLVEAIDGTGDGSDATAQMLAMLSGKRTI